MQIPEKQGKGKGLGACLAVLPEFGQGEFESGKMRVLGHFAIPGQYHSFVGAVLQYKTGECAPVRIDEPVVGDSGPEINLHFLDTVFAAAGG